jgi:hypothetical protein
MAYALGANPGTTPNANTFTSDIGSATRLATSGEFSKYLTEQIFESSAMVQSGLLATDARMNNVTGVLVELPFFAPLNYNEEVLDSSNKWGDQGKGVLTWQKQTASTQYGVFTNRTAGFSMDDLSKVETGEDALGNIASQLSRDMNRKLTAKVISQLTGLFDTALAGHVVTVGTEADAVDDLTEANFLSAGAVTQAKARLGERGNDLTVLVCHSAVAFHMQNLGMLTFQNAGGSVNYASNGVGVTNTQVGYFAGMQVVIDDQVPVSSTAEKTPVYTCYLAQPGVIRTGGQYPLTIEYARSIDTWTNQMAIKYNTCHHVLGTTFAGSPTTGLSNAALATGSNWAAAFSDTRLIPLMQLDVNTPYGGVNPAAP